MATRKHKPKKEAEEDVYVLEEEGSEDEDLDATIIEAPVDMDWIEYGVEETEDDEAPAPGRCRMTFHADMPEHVAQYLFAHHVKDGKMLVEFKPLNPTQRRKDALVSS